MFDIIIKNILIILSFYLNHLEEKWYFEIYKIIFLYILKLFFSLK